MQLIKKWTIRLAVFALALGVAAAQAKNQIRRGDQTRDHQAVCRQLSRNLPCPYSVDRAGRSCGRRSAYSRPGGASPLCYEKDVTQKMVDDYRKRQRP